MIDAIARTRLSTVYMPGDKITMLPDSVVEAFTLAEGGLRPALSLYIIVNRETQEIVATETRAERVFVKSNLRHNHLDEHVTEESLAAGSGEGGRALAREHVLSSFHLLEAVLEQVGGSWPQSKHATAKLTA